MTDLSVFALIPLSFLLFFILLVFRFFRLSQGKLLMINSLRMSFQLFLSALVLSALLGDSFPFFSYLFLFFMLFFALLKIKSSSVYGKLFLIPATLALSSSLFILLSYFSFFVLNLTEFKAQIILPLAGMILGNSMTGMIIAINAFLDQLHVHGDQIRVLTKLGVPPFSILRPLLSLSLQQALLPTLSSMAGIGIVFLPGMMTGQILAGASPFSSILYQISTMILILTSVCCSVAFTLFFSRSHFISSLHTISPPSPPSP